MSSVSDAGRSRDAGRNPDAGRAEAPRDLDRDHGLDARDVAAVEAAVEAESPALEAAALEADDGFEAPLAAEQGTTATGAEDEPAGVEGDTAVGSTEISDDTLATVDVLEREIQERGWVGDPAAASDLADRVKDVLTAVPEADRPAVQEMLMGPVEEVARFGLFELDTGRISPERVESVAAFSELVGHPVIDALAQNLRTATERGDIEARDALAGALVDIAQTNQQANVQRGAARTLLHGPVEVLREGLSGRIDGLDANTLAHLSRTRGTADTDARLRSVADQLDPSVNQALDAYGLSQARVPEPSIEGVHGLLDVAGLVPGVGEIADAANATLYALQGRFGDALLSASALLPFGSLGTGGRALNRAADGVGGGGGAARLAGAAREDRAEAFLQNLGFDARRANLETNGTDIDIILTTPNGRYAVLVGGDRKAMVDGQIDDAAVQETLERFRRAEEAALDPDGPFRTDGAGAKLMFERETTDPRVIDRFIEELGPAAVIVF